MIKHPFIILWQDNFHSSIFRSWFFWKKTCIIWIWKISRGFNENHYRLGTKNPWRVKQKHMQNRPWNQSSQLVACPGSSYRISFGTTPHPVTVTTRIIPFLIGNPYKPSFVTVTGWGVDQRYRIGWDVIFPLGCQSSSRHVGISKDSFSRTTTYSCFCRVVGWRQFRFSHQPINISFFPRCGVAPFWWWPTLSSRHWI